MRRAKERFVPPPVSLTWPLLALTFVIVAIVSWLAPNEDEWTKPDAFDAGVAQ